MMGLIFRRHIRSWQTQGDAGDSGLPPGSVSAGGRASSGIGTTPWPAHTRKRVVQRAARDAEGAAHRRLARAMLKGGNDRFELFRINRQRAAIPPSPAFGGGQPGLDPFPGQSAFVLGQFAVWRGGVHLFGQRPEPHPFAPQSVHNLEWVGQCKPFSASAFARRMSST